MKKISCIIYFVFITLFSATFVFAETSNSQNSQINWEQLFKEENVPRHLQADVKNFMSNYFDQNFDLAILFGEGLLPKIIKHYGNTSEEVYEMLYFMGNLYDVSNILEKSIDYFQRANILGDNHFLTTHEYYIIETKYSLAFNLLKIGKQNEGLILADEVLNIVQHSSDEKIFTLFSFSKNIILYQILDLKLNLLTNSHNIVETKNTLNQIKHIIDNDNSIPNEEVLKYYNHLGIYYGYLEQWTDMLAALEEGRALLDKNSESYDFSNNNFLHNIGMALTQLGQYDEALKIYLDVEKYMENNNNFYESLGLNVYSNLGRLYSDMEYFDKSLIYYQKAISLIEEEEILNEALLAQTLINLSAVYLQTGKLDEGKKIIHRAQIISDKKNEFLQNQLKQIFARLYFMQLDFDEAEKYMKEVILNLTTRFGDNSPQLIMPNQFLSTVYTSSGKSLEAIKLSKKNIILMKSQDNNFSQLILAHQLYSYSQALASYEMEFPDDEYFMGNQPFQETIEIAEEALLIYKKFFDDHDFSVIFAKNALGWYQHMSGNYIDGLQNVYESVEGVRGRLLNKVETKTVYGSKLDEKKQSQEILNIYLGILFDHILVEDVFSHTPDEKDFFITEAFETAQLLSATKANDALKKMGARAAASTPELQNLIFQKDQNVATINQLNDVLINLQGVLKEEKKIDKINSIKNQITDLINANQSIYNAIQDSFPEYNDISGNKIIGVDELQNLLNSNEVVYFFHQDFSATVFFVIDKENLIVERLFLTPEELQKKINKLRDSLDLNKVNSLFDLKDFPEDVSFDLYKKLFASDPLTEKVLEGKKNIIIIPTGYFNTIPYWTLLTSNTYPKKIKTDMFSYYSTLPWMPLKYSISVVPSVYSFTILRSQKEKNNSINSFVGIGNPIFNDDQSIDVSSIAFNDLFTKGGIADIKKINQFASLPETEEELRLIAKNFLPQNTRLYLKKEASEEIIKTENLSKADVIAFSTHATVSGELGIAEPGLILTPPKIGSKENDGILTASEIAELKLNANLVLLSACNTAESGRYDTEPLSGLVRAFFFAGAKSLLVSHWSVESESAYRITTKMFERIATGDTKSEALRKSIVHLIKDPEIYFFSHPAFWAPFMLVGDGL